MMISSGETTLPLDLDILLPSLRTIPCVNKEYNAGPSTSEAIAPFKHLTWVKCCYAVLAIVSNSYPPLVGRLPTRYSPVRNSSNFSKLKSSAFYLHVLGTPPAFVLSQDQTLI